MEQRIIPGLFSQGWLKAVACRSPNIRHRNSALLPRAYFNFLFRVWVRFAQNALPLGHWREWSPVWVCLLNFGFVWLKTPIHWEFQAIKITKRTQNKRTQIFCFSLALYRARGLARRQDRPQSDFESNGYDYLTVYIMPDRAAIRKLSISTRCTA